ncbi:hypothetical protein GA0115234_11651 [Streptomyces sp. DvalAA-43]|nr:hypothetical protein GA0115234_11651 [Streptomyces sp. DvalAA-43]
MLYVELAPSNRYKNHNRRCANDNGNHSGRTCRPNTTRPSNDPNRDTNPPTVGSANNA